MVRLKFVHRKTHYTKKVKTMPEINLSPGSILPLYGTKISNETINDSKFGSLIVKKRGGEYLLPSYTSYLYRSKIIWTRI